PLSLHDAHPISQLLDLTTALEGKEKTCEPLEKEIARINKSLDLKKTIEEQLREIDKLSSQRDTAETGFKTFLEEYGTQITGHEKVREIGEELRDWKRLTLNCADLDKDILNKK